MWRRLYVVAGSRSRHAVCIISSAQKHGFSAGADLRELYESAASLSGAERVAGVRDFLERIHARAECHRRLAVCDHRRRARRLFWRRIGTGAGLRHYRRRQDGALRFPELRLGLIPGFGGIPRLKRDLGNAFVRDLLLTGRSVNATRAQAVGLVRSWRPKARR